MSVYALQEVYDALATHAGIRALVANGTTPETYRVYSLVLPQNTAYPAITFHNVAGERPATLAGNNEAWNLRIRVHCWDTTLYGAKAVAEQVRYAFAAATLFRATQLIEFDQHEPDTGIFQSVLDFSIWYNEELPT